MGPISAISILDSPIGPQGNVQYKLLRNWNSSSTRSILGYMIQRNKAKFLWPPEFWGYDMGRRENYKTNSYRNSSLVQS